jgi:hypothetical protein
MRAFDFLRRIPKIAQDLLWLAHEKPPSRSPSRKKLPQNGGRPGGVDFIYSFCQDIGIVFFLRSVGSGAVVARLGRSGINHRTILMQTRLAWLGILVALWLGVPMLPAATSGDGAYQYEITSDNSAIVTNYLGTQAELVVPAELDGYLVTGIGAGAFEWRDGLESVTLPISVTNIGSAAFRFCLSLTNLVIPDSVENIGERAFQDCASLSGLTIPSTVRNIGSIAFYGCLALTNIVIPEGVSRVEWWTFAKCANLSRVTLPDSLTSIGDEAFSGCSRLGSLTIPSNVLVIGSLAFKDCTSLTGIALPPALTSLSDETFRGCSALSQLVLPGGITTIGQNAFYGCSALAEITLPDGVTILADGAFRGCSSLAQVSLPSGLTTIGKDTFYQCSALTRMTVPATVRSLGDKAFYNCGANLQCLYFAGDAPELVNSNTVFFNDTQLTCYYLAGATGWATTLGGRPTVRLTSATPALTVAPSYGQTAPGNLVTGNFAVVSEYLLTPLVQQGTTQYVAAGATVAGNAYTVVSPTNVMLTLTNHAALTWLWQTNYYFVAGAGAGGSVTGGTNGWYLAGTMVTLTATPAANYHFAGWTGDTPGGLVAGHSITATMTQARTITANFALNGQALIIISSHGTGTRPASSEGILYYQDYGTPLSERMTGVETIGATQYVCTGGTVAGNDYTRVAPTNVTLTLTNDATLTWQWQTNYDLSATAGTGGSVTGSTNGWYARGTQVVLNAVAASNTHLLAWQGDTNGCVAAGATLLVPMDQARAITATFVITTNRTLTVVSAHGGASPGTTVAYYGTPLLCAITNSPVVVGATQYVCTGATVAGNGFTMLSPTNATILLTNNAVLTWRWTTNYLLRVATNGNGSVNLPESWQAKGSSVLVVARPGAFARFGAWSGEIKGCKIKTNTLTAVMTTPRTITANFIGQGTVTAVASPADGGTVTGGGTADTNKSFNLRAMPKANWNFAGWADGAFLPASRTVVVAPGGQTYTARFTMATGELVLSTNRLAFGAVRVGQVATQQVTVTSLGPNPVTVKSMKLPRGCTVTRNSFVLWSGNSVTLTITYTPTRAGALDGAVVFTSDAARGLGAGCLTLSGTAVLTLPKPESRATAADGPALVMRVVELGVPAPVPDAEEDLSAVRLVGGRVRVESLWPAGSGTIAIESSGTDHDADGLPDALEAALGAGKQEGMTLLILQRSAGTIRVTTPFVERLTVEGAPAPQADLPATWRLVPVAP